MASDLRVVLNYILHHAKNDERPYLKVSIFGNTVLGLLDSGSSRTILGGRGWTVVRDMGVELRPVENIKCTVANGNQCVVSGVCRLPMVLEGRLRVIEVLVIPQLPHLLILGWEFWKSMGVVPVVHEWYFSDEPPLVSSVELLHAQIALMI